MTPGISIAHLSDPHLGPMPRPGLRRLLSKRILGYINWHRNRKNFHVRAVADLMVEDLKKRELDHIIVSGDLVNVSLEEEFVQAARWLETFGTEDAVTVVPGNHDTYVPLAWEKGLGLWEPYMQADARGAAYPSADDRFPFVRIVGNVALVALSSAEPMPFFFATGRLGEAQIEALDEVLEALRIEGFYRIVIVHHPPLPGQCKARKALIDAAELRAVLVERGADLVLHGHNHRAMLESLETRHGMAYIFGVPSASAGHHGHVPAAQYNIYTIGGGDNAHACTVTVRGYDPGTDTFSTLHSFEPGERAPEPLKEDTILP